MSGSSGISEDGRAVLAGPFALVQRLVGVVQDLFGVLAVVRIDRAADGDREAERLAVRAELLAAKLRDEAVGHEADPLATGSREDDLELVAAEAGDGRRSRRAGDEVLGADRLRERLRHVLQDLVPDVVAEAVVDLLEVVDVDHDDPELPRLALGARDLLVEPLLEMGVVPEAGEAVLVGLFVKARVLDGDRRVAREDLRDLDLLLSERGRAGRVVEVEGADRLVVEQDRQAEDRPQPEPLDGVDELEPRLGDGLAADDALLGALDGHEDRLREPPLFLVQPDAGAVAGDLDLVLPAAERHDRAALGAAAFDGQLEDLEDGLLEVGPPVDLADDFEDGLELGERVLVERQLLPAVLWHHPHSTRRNSNFPGPGRPDVKSAGSVVGSLQGPGAAPPRVPGGRTRRRCFPPCRPKRPAPRSRPRSRPRPSGGSPRRRSRCRPAPSPPRSGPSRTSSCTGSRAAAAEPPSPIRWRRRPRCRRSSH